MCLIFSALLSFLFTWSLSSAMNNRIMMKKNNFENLISDTIIIQPKDSVKNKLIEEVENYIYANFPKAHKTIPTSLVEIGLEHKIDIMFMMAQTQIETHYGTLGAGRESSRRSLFGVANRKYDSYEKAISDYVSVLKKSYLTRSRTEKHLMRNYTTVSGKRYAENPNYEVDLKGAYTSINKKTRIKSLQEEYHKFDEKERKTLLCYDENMKEV